MSSTSVLESEELENVPLVRMEDVQPDRSVEKVENLVKNDVELDSDCASQYSQEGLESFILDSSLDDENSNIGSMVSIESEEIIGEETELIVPEFVDSVQVPVDIDKPDSPLQTQSTTEYVSTKPSPPDRWPTLEILPGGVINISEKAETTVDPLMARDNSENGMMYECAKCSLSFKYLFCLVKHVRWHEEEKERAEIMKLKLTPIQKKMADLQQRSKEMDLIMKKHRRIMNTPRETPIQKKMADLQQRSKEMDLIMKKHRNNGIMNIPKEKFQSEKQKLKQMYICLNTGKRKIISKPKLRRAPKKK